ncbi:response regulator [Geoalkalibacter halelectricus]|uniref:Response regulator n=1 Tax=Geoalkalibacter halelectricus TaxID=2847045 RepID=A0ABY5ZM44_9BACT|nr:response regulator [Geoalkalibacter halelectricus]MDO3378474.1 response regulator [Geoalkalibacter halelectricus]UWZ80206.1 response regulator [Geoalkalibacter halelectricus]
MPPYKILLAATNPLVSQWRERLALPDTFSLLTADNSTQALDLARSEQPCLAILDADLGPENGAQLCQHLRTYSWLRNLAVIILAQPGVDSAVEYCRRWQCQRVLSKPLSDAALLDAIVETLAQRPLVSRAPRIAQRLPVRYSRTDRRDRRGHTIDLSPGGFFLQTDGLYTTATLVHFEIFLGENLEPLCGRARVAWVNHHQEVLKPLYPQGMGLQFIDLGTQGARVVEEYLHRQANLLCMRKP